MTEQKEKKYPTRIIVMGLPYKITYVKDLNDVDFDKKEKLLGCVDLVGHKIRVYIGEDRTREAIWQTLWHEIIHAIAYHYKLSTLEADENHRELDLLAGAINALLLENRTIVL